jgi:hypothetical protein
MSNSGAKSLMCRLSINPGALTSRTPQGHVGLFRGYYTFTAYLQKHTHTHTHIQAEVRALGHTSVHIPKFNPTGPQF